MIATYTNKVLQETYELAGVKNLQHAWKIYKTICMMTGWNPEMFSEDVKIKLK